MQSTSLQDSTRFDPMQPAYGAAYASCSPRDLGGSWKVSDGDEVTASVTASEPPVTVHAPGTLSFGNGSPLFSALLLSLALVPAAGSVQPIVHRAADLGMNFSSVIEHFASQGARIMVVRDDPLGSLGDDWRALRSVTDVVMDMDMKPTVRIHPGLVPEAGFDSSLDAARAWMEPAADEGRLKINVKPRLERLISCLPAGDAPKRPAIDFVSHRQALRNPPAEGAFDIANANQCPTVLVMPDRRWQPVDTWGPVSLVSGCTGLLASLHPDARFLGLVGAASGFFAYGAEIVVNGIFEQDRIAFNEHFDSQNHLLLKATTDVDGEQVSVVMVVPPSLQAGLLKIAHHS